MKAFRMFPSDYFHNMDIDKSLPISGYGRADLGDKYRALWMSTVSNGFAKLRLGCGLPDSYIIYYMVALTIC